MEDAYGVIPYPKYTENDSYASNVDAGVHIMVVLTTAKDPERTSIILEALSAEGQKTVMPAFYEVAAAGQIHARRYFRADA